MTRSGAAEVSQHTVIERSRGWAPLNLRELWAYRDLLLILASRDVKLRYKQTLLGIVWVVAQPVGAAVIFTIVFGLFLRMPSDNVPYLVFVYAGLLPWNLFAGAVQRAGNSLVTESHLISKVYFPRMIVPLAGSSAVLVDFAVSFLVMLLMMAAAGVPPTPRLLAIPLLVVVTLVVSFGVTLCASALSVYYRDFAYVLPFVVQIWMYASPIIYPLSAVPEPYRDVFALNPLVGLVEGFRWAVGATPTFPGPAVGIAVGVSCLLLVGGALVFRRVERAFADVI